MTRAVPLERVDVIGAINGWISGGGCVGRLFEVGPVDNPTAGIDCRYDIRTARRAPTSAFESIRVASFA